MNTHRFLSPGFPGATKNLLSRYSGNDDLAKFTIDGQVFFCFIDICFFRAPRPDR
jgi:hypothetical protein